MQRHWVVVLLPSPTESRSSTSAKLAVLWNRSASLGRSQKAAMRRSVLSQGNLCRHQKSRWVRCRVVDTLIRLRRDVPHGSVSRIGLSRPRVPMPCCLTSMTRSQRTCSRTILRMAGRLEPRQVRRNVSVGSSCHGPSRHEEDGRRASPRQTCLGNLPGV